MVREIGGYLELETFSGEQYHQNAIALNCGRGCIKYLVELRHIKKIWIPDYICDSVSNAFKSMGTETKVYHINERFLPDYNFKISEGEWLFLNDYYGQLNFENIRIAKKIANDRLIVDETQGFFNEAYEGVDTFYSCRKWFGVSDGAFLVTGDRNQLERVLDRDESHKRMIHVLGRYERTATEYYEQACKNNDFFDNEPAKQMSWITDNLLRAVDYDEVIKRRCENWDYLAELLCENNYLRLNKPVVPFMYPLLVNKNYAKGIRIIMAKKKIYIPVLWPNVGQKYGDDHVAGGYADAILPLPVDQRYGKKEMRYIGEIIKHLLS